MLSSSFPSQPFTKLQNRVSYLYSHSSSYFKLTGKEMVSFRLRSSTFPPELCTEHLSTTPTQTFQPHRFRYRTRNVFESYIPSLKLHKNLSANGTRSYFLHQCTVIGLCVQQLQLNIIQYMYVLTFTIYNIVDFDI